MTVFVHPQALCEATEVGDGTRVWAFAHILPGARLGIDCNVCDSVFIENDVVVGDRVTIKCGVQLWDGVTLEDDVFVGPNATFTNDPFPRSKQYPHDFAQTVVRRGASIGANSTILPGLTIGQGALVGAGSVVTRDVPDRAIVVGNPARVTGYTDTRVVTSRILDVEPSDEGELRSGVAGVQLVALDRAVDMRGALVAGETSKHIPFVPERFFVVHEVPTQEVRGAHAHRRCEQFLVCLRGSVNAIVDDGTARAEYLLDGPDTGLYMPAMTWGTQYRYSDDAVLLVIASHAYDPKDYIRDYDEFLQAAVAARADNF
jgi:acetyltransferase-like isoleucine patch superfamily enzyme/dTDP-4-dehydrorhamnose 3,5-epimerase-like enzyme